MDLFIKELQDLIKEYVFFKPNNIELKKAVSLWCKNRNKALQKIWSYFKLEHVFYYRYELFILRLL